MKLAAALDASSAAPESMPSTPEPAKSTGGSAQTRASSSTKTPTPAYLVAESRYSLTNVELLRCLYEDEGQPWRWTAPEFTLRIPIKGRIPTRITLKVHLPEPTAERTIAIHCAGQNLGTNTLALSGDHLLTRSVQIET